MSRFPAFTKTLRDQRVAALAWSVAFVVLAFVHVLMYPQYRDAASALSQNTYFQALAGEAGGIGTPSGYINAEYFTGIPLLVLIFAIVAGSGLISGDESSGTLDLVLAQPIRRTRLLIEKTLALGLLVIVVSLSSLPGLLAAKIFIEFDVSWVRLAEACLAIAPISMLYAGIAVLGSAAIPSRTGAAVVGIGAAIAGFFLNTFGAFVDPLEQVRKLSPFYWANYGRVLTGGFEWGRAGIFVAGACLLVAAGAFIFERRDVTSGTRAWINLPGWRRRAAAANSARESANPARFPVFSKTLRDQRAAIVGWGVTIFLLSFVHVVIYPQFREAFKAFDDVGAFTPLAGAAGTISSPAGYLALEYFSYIPLLILIAGVIAGTGVIAGEETAGTLDLLLAQPVSRRRLVIEKTAALVTVITVIVLASLPGLLIAKYLVDFEMSVVKMVSAAVYMLPLTLLYLSLAIFGSAALPSRTTGAILVIGAAVAGYFLNTLGAYVDALDGARRLSPFYWADFPRVMLDGFDFGRAVVFLALALAILVAAVVLFARRDVSSTVRVRLPRFGHRETRDHPASDER